LRGTRIAEFPDALAYLAEAFDDARKVYLEAARTGALDVFGRRSVTAHNRELIPREDWYRCEWYELADPLSTGFHFDLRLGWCDREVQCDQLEALRPRIGPPLGRPPRETDVVVAAIERALQEGKLTIEELPTIKDVVLETLVGGTRHTRREARQLVLQRH
jgi:hypothetical protein